MVNREWWSLETTHETWLAIARIFALVALAAFAFPFL